MQKGPHLHEQHSRSQRSILGTTTDFHPTPTPFLRKRGSSLGPSPKPRQAHHTKHRGVSYTYPSMCRHICQAHAAASHRLCCDAAATRPGGLTTSQNRCKHCYNSGTGIMTTSPNLAAAWCTGGAATPGMPHRCTKLGQTCGLQSLHKPTQTQSLHKPTQTH